MRIAFPFSRIWGLGQQDFEEVSSFPLFLSILDALKRYSSVVRHCNNGHGIQSFRHCFGAYLYLSDSPDLWICDNLVDMVWHFGTFAIGKNCLISLKSFKTSHWYIDFDAKDSFGWTPFMKACKNGHEEVIKLLFNY